jgi:IS1 family transposase
VVEIDESKFGKVKYHRGHRVEGVWVVGGVERTAERKVFLTTVVDRTAETMEDVITRFVKPGSIIHTDNWRAYNQIPEWQERQEMDEFQELVNGAATRARSMDYQHRSVNHSVEFITADGVHTNTIEGTWNGIKMKVPARYRTALEMPWKLVEFIWRRQNHGNHWQGLLDTLKDVSFTPLANNQRMAREDQRTPMYTSYTGRNRDDGDMDDDMDDDEMDDDEMDEVIDSSEEEEEEDDDDDDDDEDYEP